MRVLRPQFAVIVTLSLTLLLVCAAAHAVKHFPAKPIDLNLASLKELEELPGVGRVTAQKIIDLRQKSGRFKRVEDLLAVRGISPKKLDAMRPYIRVAVPGSSAASIQKNSPPAKKQ